MQIADRVRVPRAVRALIGLALVGVLLVVGTAFLGYRIGSHSARLPIEPAAALGDLAVDSVTFFQNSEWARGIPLLVRMSAGPGAKSLYYVKTATLGSLTQGRPYSAGAVEVYLSGAAATAKWYVLIQENRPGQPAKYVVTKQESVGGPVTFPAGSPTDSLCIIIVANEVLNVSDTDFKKLVRIGVKKP